MAAFLLTTFLGSFLLFQVQPLIGRYILPWFGGSPAVWTTCMLFFQVMLLAGYSYAHLLTLVNRKKQACIHAALLAIALAFLPIAPSPELWKPAPDGNPILQILLLLLANIGAPYLALSATAPLIQHWFVRSYPGKSPYRLYSLSNTASLLALLSYPFLVEPNFTLFRQVSAWGWGFAAFVLCCGWCALRPVFKNAGTHADAWSNGCGQDDTIGTADAAPGAEGREGLSTGSVFLWLSLSACGSAVLLATTNQLCQEVAVVPFLWVAPLALYLATFAICFNSDRAYSRLFWMISFAAALVPAFWLLHVGLKATLPVQVFVYLVTLLACCMACHGELARSRPDSRHLTAYYLTISTGGALGGTLVALGAPLFFSGFWEFPVAMILTAMTLTWALYRQGALKQAPRWSLVGIVAGVLALMVFTASYIRDADNSSLASSRNFYGVLRVVQLRGNGGDMLFLRHGRVMHGSQYSDPGLRNAPTSYYGPDSGAALALRFHPRRNEPSQGRGALRVGVIGLGTGTLAAYGTAGDIFRFYEINSEVTKFADRYFTFRRDSAARIETVSGDARIIMESEFKRDLRQRFDVLLVDAFSSDSVPAHLLTRECFQIYQHHLNPDGLLVVHVTNRYLDLIPVVQAQADQMGLQAVLVQSSGDAKKNLAPAKWMILTKNMDFLNRPAIRARLTKDAGKKLASFLWTDDFVSLWQILKW